MLSRCVKSGLLKPTRSIQLRRTYATSASEVFTPLDTFERRHIGPRDADLQEMLKTVGFTDLTEFSKSIVPNGIQLKTFELGDKGVRGEADVLVELKQLASKNHSNVRSFIGMGYYNTVTPPIILRNVLENPAWYTPYTPYQAEVSQGRLESLLNYQTMVQDLTGLDMSNASLLDEATAAAEAMSLAYGYAKKKKNTFFVSDKCHPQTIAVVKTRAEPLDINVVVGDHKTFSSAQFKSELCGALVQYPNTDGTVDDLTSFVEEVHKAEALAICATDLLALTVLRDPGSLKFDIALGSAQRFGVPPGYGGPHAAFFATKDDVKRIMPGRVIGVSKDAQGNRALRMAMQTREQHIRREKATSNICTAQALLSNMAAFYAVYHGPNGLKQIATNVHQKALLLAEALKSIKYSVQDGTFFDTIRINSGSKTQALVSHLEKQGFNVRNLDNVAVTVSLDETTTQQDVEGLLSAFASFAGVSTPSLSKFDVTVNIPSSVARSTPYLTHPIFNSFHSETEMLRYMYRLQLKDIGLTTSMIPLGSCTMKLNATSEMIPVTWPELCNIHPFAPVSQAQGWQEILRDLEKALTVVTGLPAVSLQPNAGSQGEYAGLLVIRKYHQKRGQGHRKICLIPLSAHGTNPASAVMAGMDVVTVACDSQGNVDVADLRAKAEKHKDNLSALMVTYPSTHGVYEEQIREITKIVHDFGGQVYMDGANMNAQVGLTSPGSIGADVCHLNLHKTFCIPHGGGGPGMGPIAVAAHLAPYLPSHPVVSSNDHSDALGPVSAAPWGSADILTISWVYIKLMGSLGLIKATQVAMLNANYMAKRLEKHYPILYKGKGDLVAHEFIIDLHQFKKVGIEAEDLAKRLMDFGFHAPTMSFPVVNTLMVEPTESESKEELDRFVDAMIKIREEIRDVEEGRVKSEDSVLKHAPHTQYVVISSEWNRKYTREEAVYPLPYVRKNKWWPTVGRIDNVFGDRNLICSCPPLSEY
eukprot:TRINITY_DN12269_c0_g1_i1.p1 TRINITY_DN12269_c0_g1~~TRINITY_DN12269_c0_g1_i1.p1  ORF type:complete len:984 (-),score=282.56 TRINITY_DN12269_c0_g1_i1:142-3093(-)